MTQQILLPVRNSDDLTKWNQLGADFMETMVYFSTIPHDDVNSLRMCKAQVPDNWKRDDWRETILHCGSNNTDDIALEFTAKATFNNVSFDLRWIHTSKAVRIEKTIRQVFDKLFYEYKRAADVMCISDSEVVEQQKDTDIHYKKLKHFVAKHPNYGFEKDVPSVAHVHEDQYDEWDNRGYFDDKW